MFTGEFRSNACTIEYRMTSLNVAGKVNNTITKRTKSVSVNY